MDANQSHKERNLSMKHAEHNMEKHTFYSDTCNVLLVISLSAKKLFLENIRDGLAVNSLRMQKHEKCLSPKNTSINCKENIRTDKRMYRMKILL